MVTATFGGKEFKVNADGIYTPDGLTIGESIEFEETEVSQKKPTQKLKAVKLQSLSFDVRLDARFVVIATELRWWKDRMLAHESGIFTLGNVKIGKFYVTQYDVKEIRINRGGVWTSAVLTLTFTEDGSYANNNSISFEVTEKAKSVKSSADSAVSGSDIKVGTKIRPKSGVRWYYTAEGAINRTGKSGRAKNGEMTVSYVYKSGRAINPGGMGWLVPEDVDIV